jgi:hypothetical protein
MHGNGGLSLQLRQPHVSVGLNEQHSLAGVVDNQLAGLYLKPCFSANMAWFLL